MKFGRLFCFLSIIITLQVKSQVTFPENDVVTPNHDYYAFINAHIFIDHETVIDEGVLLVRDGHVVEVGKSVSLPENTIVKDLQGKYIYPSFIDIYSDYAMKKDDKKKDALPRRARSPQLNSTKKGAFYWNESVHPERNANEDFSLDTKQASELRSFGYGTVLTHKHDGVVRGTSVLVTLGEEKELNEIIEGKAAFQLAFNKGSSKQNYPTSLMGVIALIRQAYYDALWYETQPNKKAEYNISLEAFHNCQQLPAICDAGSYLSVLRADKIADEFATDFIIKGSGEEYRRTKEIKEANVKLIIPLDFPKLYDVEDPYQALNISLSEMKNWELAPANPSILAKEGIPFVFTLNGLKDKKDFLTNLRKSVKCGLSEQAALKALTSDPAKFIGQSSKVGDLKTGKLANFFIASGNVFNDQTIIHENWVRGKQYLVNERQIDIRGKYNLNVDGISYQLAIEGTLVKPTASVAIKNDKVKVKLTYFERSVQLSFPLNNVDSANIVRLGGNINDDESRIWAGKAEMPNGSWKDWAAIRQSAHIPEQTDSTNGKNYTCGLVWFPDMAYGFDSLPKPEVVIFQNATIWTNEDTGIIHNSDLAIANGKILAIGNNITRVSLFGDKEIQVRTINAKGMHITSGIIDEHSHIAVNGGVNEAGWNISSEVRIGDVINSDDINIYRQLSGGVTAAQLLHGSANPIGGQSALIKLRWGRTPEEMKIKGADGFIKFALGENVKQSNWGDLNKVRFPQTRMGVEQLYYDAFTRASQYKELWQLHQAAELKKRKKDIIVPPRKDLRLEALSEILDTNRFITCHSYIQSEINMLMHVADSMKFRINTFTHVLEGYKVADKIRDHGAAASTFSDWWAYKFEVNDAIPYNGAMLNEQNVLTAFNSDDAEMGRRLNQEAAKAVKYGGVSEEEAWKFITLNPARMLHLDDRMGSLKKGKDADIVLWSGNPLSIDSKVEMTFIDGICYFDRQRDLNLRKKIVAERARLTQKMLAAKKNGEKTQEPKQKKNKEYHCDTIDAETETWIEE